jgi:hypothetical protein
MSDFDLLVKENEMIENDLWDYILSFMLKVEKVKKLRGIEKKKWVLKRVKELLGDEAYDRYEPMIIVSIDMVVSLSKNRKNFLKSFKHNKLYFCC